MVLRQNTSYSFIKPLICLIWALPLLASATSEQAVEVNTEKGKTYAFECFSGYQFVVQISPSGNWLFGEQGGVQLGEPGGLTAYTAPGLELQIDGDNAILREEGKTTQICTNNRKQAIWENAKLNGVDFRAIGNEPGWSLEFIESSKIVLISDYGKTRIERAMPEANTDTDAKTTRWEAGDLLIEVSAGPCADSMSDDRYESTVRINWQGQILQGCGQALH